MGESWSGLLKQVLEQAWWEVEMSSLMRSGQTTGILGNAGCCWVARVTVSHVHRAQYTWLQVQNCAKILGWLQEVGLRLISERPSAINATWIVLCSLSFSPILTVLMKWTYYSSNSYPLYFDRNCLVSYHNVLVNSFTQASEDHPMVKVVSIGNLA